MLNRSAIPRPKRRPAPPPEREIEVREDYITLGQLLKAADIIQSGGEAKPYLAEVPVEVNGEPEQRRGRKLRPGDLIVTPHSPPLRLVASPEPPVSTPATQLMVSLDTPNVTPQGVDSSEPPASKPTLHESTLHESTLHESTLHESTLQKEETSEETSYVRVKKKPGGDVSRIIDASESSS